MAQNINRMSVGPFTIKWTDYFPIDHAQAEKIIDGINCAKHVLREAAGHLRTLSQEKRATPLAQQVFLHHFKLDLENLGTDSVVETRLWWVIHILERARRGLDGQVTIADAWGSRFGNALRRETLFDTSNSSPEQLMQKAFNQAVGEGGCELAGYVIAKPKYLDRMDNELPGFKEDHLKDHMVKFDLTDRTALSKTDYNRNTNLQPSDQLRAKALIDPKEGWGSIHLNYPMILQEGYGRLRMARVIIHEASHKFANTMDHAYSDKLAYDHLMVQKALINADSHAFAAICLSAGEFFREDNDLKGYILG